MDAEESSSKTLFKKKVPFFRGVKRKIEKDSDSDLSSSDDETVVVKKYRQNIANPLIQSTSSFNKKRSFNTASTNKASNNEDEQQDSIVSVVYKSDKTGDSIVSKDMGATATLNIDTDKDRDAQAIFERARKLNEDKDIDEANVYKGLNNYKQYIQKKDTALGNASSGLVRQGPIRAPDNLRSTVRWDYQPDVCKDYKETGFCGFGLSCKFLHDRSDFKHGWQLELEVQKGTYNKEDEEDYEIKDEEKLPFKCLICRKSYKKPVKTKCNHYFCEVCAIGHFKKSTSCFVCGVPTGGIFNQAKEIIKMLETKKDSNVSSDEEDEEKSGNEQEEEDED